MALANYIWDTKALQLFIDGIVEEHIDRQNTSKVQTHLDIAQILSYSGSK